MPESLHEALARAADAERTSLNAFIVAALEETTNGHRSVTTRHRGANTRERQTGTNAGSRTVGRLLVVNLIVVAAVGILAVALLVQALR
jgi:hypothetical protein